MNASVNAIAGIDSIKLDTAKEYLSQAIAALSQNKTFNADVDLAETAAVNALRLIRECR